VAFGKKVLELGYRHIYYREGEVSLAAGKRSEIPGWIPTPNNQRVTLEEYRAALHRRQYLNPSRQALQECLAFKYDATGNVVHGLIDSPADPTGARVNHGDRVIADALSWKMMRALGAARPREQIQGIIPGSLAWRRKIAENAQTSTW
jgi:hypothetical protein